jgi:NDP-sugar pyrophosphorylase family protein
MKMGIIAAGTGERIARGGVTIPKPLLPVGGRPLIARIIDGAARLDVTSVACIVNDLSPSVAGFLQSSAWPVDLELIVKTTPSSMESLFSLAPLLSDEPFILFTVDVVAGHKTIEDFLLGARCMADATGVLALTEHIDDEKPLWVTMDGNNRITAMGEAAKGSRYVTAGFYYFTPDIFSLVDAARARKFGALRQFLGLLVERGYVLNGLPVPKTMDVDYPEDVAKAEAFLEEINEL